MKFTPDIGTGLQFDIMNIFRIYYFFDIYLRFIQNFLFLYIFDVPCTIV